MLKKKKTTVDAEATENNSSNTKTKKKLDTSEGGIIWTIWHYIMAILLVTLGVLAIIYSDRADVQKQFLVVVGGFIIFDGSLRILMNFLPALTAHDKRALSFNFAVSGSFELAAGITLIMMQNEAAGIIAKSLSLFFAILCITIGATLLLFAIAFIVSKLYKLYLPILEILLAGCFIALGVVVIVYMKQQDFYRVVLILTGIAVILAGTGELIGTTVSLMHHNKEVRSQKYRAQAAAASTNYDASYDLTNNEEKQEEIIEEQKVDNDAKKDDIIDAEVKDAE